jgi:hypothetical protein
VQVVHDGGATGGVDEDVRGRHEARRGRDGHELGDRAGHDPRQRWTSADEDRTIETEHAIAEPHGRHGGAQGPGLTTDVVGSAGRRVDGRRMASPRTR